MKIETLLKFRDIKLFFFDLDGVLLNDAASAEKSIAAISKYSRNFIQLGAGFGIITAREEDDVIGRIKLIEGCFVISGSVAKVNRTDKLLKSLSIDFKNVFYMGDGLLDIPLLQKCGLSCAPKHARREVRRVVSFTSSSEKSEDVLKEILNYFKKSKEPASRATKH
jgi:3-deoxy-D-manno-octulosonate 8-phosphate phosphatase (KDO 8-P phosphatase)